MSLSATMIKKGLECCSKDRPLTKKECMHECPYFNVLDCKRHCMRDAVDIINRLKAENKNCGVKIQNQREQLKACNEKIKEQQAEIEWLKYINKREKRQSEKAKDKESSLGVLDDLLTKSYKENKELKAEIERLKSTVNRIKRYDEERDIRLHARLIATAKSEAYKEFLEAYKDQIKKYAGMFTDEGFYEVLSVADFVFEKMKEEMGCE